MSDLSRAYVDSMGRLPGTPGYDFETSTACESGLDEPCECGVFMSEWEAEQGACAACYTSAMCDLREQEFQLYKKERDDG